MHHFDVDRAGQGITSEAKIGSSLGRFMRLPLPPFHSSRANPPLGSHWSRSGTPSLSANSRHVRPRIPSSSSSTREAPCIRLIIPLQPRLSQRLRPLVLRVFSPMAILPAVCRQPLSPRNG